uniref:Uncharacterized protein n=1 Tax=Picea sitchensis TaxID=3332 RepID=A9NXI2_PICSI|nr:unknown [Picea sitchensis]
MMRLSRRSIFQLKLQQLASLQIYTSRALKSHVRRQMNLTVSSKL